jgi:hypothetical protein
MSAGPPTKEGENHNNAQRQANQEPNSVTSAPRSSFLQISQQNHQKERKRNQLHRVVVVLPFSLFFFFFFFAQVQQRKRKAQEKFPFEFSGGVVCLVCWTKEKEGEREEEKKKPEMPILYSVVARGSTLLAEYSSAKGNFDQVARKILDKIPSTQESKMSYVYDR